MESKFAVESCDRGTMSTKNLWDVSVGEKMPCEWYAVAVMRRSASSAMYPGRYRLFARYFWPTSCLLAISGRSETEVL